MDSFASKTVVITGGASGIGLGFAKVMGQEGANIVICDILPERIDTALAELKSLDINAVGKICNVAKMEEVEELADFSWETYGSVDVILNGAGIGSSGAVIEVDRTDIEKVLDVNFYGVWNGCKVFGSRFVEQGTPAAIYNIGSENSLYNFVPKAFAYHVTKHAVLTMTDALREEMPEYIDVSLICPGWVHTNLAPHNGMSVEEYIPIALEQLKAGKFFVVSHAYNVERIKNRYDEITEAYETYAPRYDGDDEYDLRTYIANRRKERKG